MLINVKGHLFSPTKPVCFTHPSRATFFPDEVLPTLTVYWRPPPSRGPQTSPAETIGCDCAPCIISTPSTATSHANALQTCHQHASYLQYSSTVNYLYIVLSSNRLQSSFLEEPSKRHSRPPSKFTEHLLYAKHSPGKHAAAAANDSKITTDV